MTTVARETIIQAWERVCALDEAQTTALSKRFIAEQPALSVYLLASTEQLGDEAGDTSVIDLAIAIWDAMTLTHGRRLKQVKPKAIDRAEETNTRMLEKLALGSEFEWNEAARKLIQQYNQRELLGFCIEILMSNDQETPELAPDRIGLEMLWLKTIIDGLDQ
jgi:hypothetical protein